MRRILLGIVVTLVVLGVAGFVAVPILIHRNVTPEHLARRGSELARRPVTVEDVRVTFRPGLRIRAETVQVEGALSADAVEVEIAVLPLLRRRIEPAELHLRGLRALVEVGPDGALRPRLLNPPGGGATPGASGAFTIPALEATDGEFRVVEADGTSADLPRLRILDLEVGRLRAEGRTPLRLTLAVEPGPSHRLAVEEAAFEAFLEPAPGGFAVRDGRARGRGLLLRGLQLERFEGRFAYASGRVDLERFVLEGYGGRASLSGALVSGSPARFDGGVTFEDLAFPPMVEDWRAKPPPDSMPAWLDADGQVALWLRRTERGEGSGSLALGGGTLPAGSLFSALLGSIGTLTGQILSLGGTFAPAPSEVESITASWTLRDDRLHSEDLVVVTNDYRYEASGSLGLDQTLQLDGSLQLTSRGAQRMVASASLPLPSATAVIPPIPLSVGGTLGAPSFHARVTALPGAAASALGGLVKGVGNAGKGVIDKVLRR